MERIPKGINGKLSINRRKLQCAKFVSIQDAIDRLLKYGENKKKSWQMKEECEYLIRNIRLNIDDIKLEQITIVDSILRSVPFLKSSVSQAIRCVLPNVLKQPDYKTVTLNGCLSLLTYMARTEIYISDKNEQIEKILKNLCDFTYDVDVEKASRIFKTLEIVAKNSPKHETTEHVNQIVQLSIAPFIRKITDLSLNDILSLISLYENSTEIVRDSDMLWTLCERITDRCFTSEKDFPKIIDIFTKLSDLGYSDINIIFKLDKMIENCATLLKSPKILVQLLRCYAAFDCKSLRWDDLILPAIEENLSAKKQGIFLIECTMRLLLLGHPSKKAIETVLSNEFLDQYAMKINKKPNLQNKIKAIYWYSKQKQNDDGTKYYINDITGLQRIFDHNRKFHKPLDYMISEEIGENKFLNNVKTRHGGLWNMVKLNRKTNELTDIHLTSPTETERIPVENIIVEPDEQLFIILVDRKKIFAARRGAEITRKAYLQSFERLFYPIVDIDKHIVQWMPPDQRKSYIIQRIQEKLNDLE